MGADGDDLLGATQTAAPATLAPAPVPAIPDSWMPHPSDPLRFVKAEIRQLLLRRGPLSIAQLPEEYLKFYRRPLTQALKMVDSQYTPESARGGKPSGRARKATLGAFLREHLADAVEVRQRPHGQHEIVASGTPPDAPVSGLDGVSSGAFGFGGLMGGWSSGSSGSDGASPELSRRSSRDADDVNALWHRDTPEHRIRAYILLQQQQQQSQQRQLDELRDALRRVGVTPAQSQAMTDASLGFASSPPPLRRASSDEPVPGLDALRQPLLHSSSVRDALVAARNAAPVDVDGRFGADASVAAAVGALRGAALLSAATTDVPAENRIYVTWRVPSKATPLRVEDLWNHFSRFGALAFCNPRPLRHSHAPRRAPSLSGAGYAFLGFANPGGAEAAQRALARPSHTFRGAELRVKPWRERDEGTGSGDTPATVPASAVDAPPARLSLGLGGGDVYFAHPESGAPTLAIVGAHAQMAPTALPPRMERSRGTRGEATARGFNVNAARFDPKPPAERIAQRPGSPSVFSLPADLFGEFAEEEKPGSGSVAAAVFGADFFNLGDGSGATRERASSGALEESSLDAFRSGAPEPADFGDAAGIPWGAAAPDEGVSEHETGASKSRLWSYTSEAAPVV
jgi:hypothetical protein